MKKALSLVLAMLVLFSMASIMVSAEGELVTVKFINEGEVVQTVHAAPGTNLDEYAPANPSKAATDTTEYIFKGWRCSLDDRLYYENQIMYVPTDLAEGTEITFTAEYSEKNIAERQTLWNFIESIFERINLLFQYFAKVFEW